MGLKKYGLTKALIVTFIFASGHSVARSSVSSSIEKMAKDKHHHFSLLSEVISYTEDQAKSGITVLETVLLMGEIETSFRGEVQNVSSGFQWDFHWEKPWLGAGTIFTDDRVFKVMLWGGLVRAEKMTLLGLEAVLCHEFGHLLGGKPRQIFPSQGALEAEHWSSTEGQSDWWAATVCLPRIYKARGLLPSEIRDRIENAGLDFALFAHFHFERASPAPSLALSASEEPPQTLTLAYPSLQCRLDTFKTGAESALGLAALKRPRCWFAD